MNKLQTGKNTQIDVNLIHRCVIILLCTLCTLQVKAEKVEPDSLDRFAVSTNVLYWLTTTPNVGMEIATSRRFSLAESIGYNAFNLPDKFGAPGGDLSNPKLNHWLLTQESRLWLRRVYEGSYFGLHLMGGKYNIGGLAWPKILRDYRYQGYTLGVGLSYGHEWKLGDHWRIGASIGAGWMYLNYDKYNCGCCGKRVSHRARHLATITNASLSFKYIFPTHRRTVIKHVPTYVEETPVVIHETPDTAHNAIEKLIYEPEKEVNDTLKFGVYYDVNQHEPIQLRLNSYLDSLRGREILSVKIDGYASPEYTAIYNLMLSERRARGVAEQIARVLVIPASGITMTAHGDDWEGLRHKAEVVMMGDEVNFILDSNSDPEIRKQDLRALSDYRVLLYRVFPLLRRTEVTIIYR